MPHFTECTARQCWYTALTCRVCTESSYRGLNSVWPLQASIHICLLFCFVFFLVSWLFYSFFFYFIFLPWRSLRAGKCQEGYHLPQSGHTPRLGQHYCPCGVRHYLTSVDTGQLPTAYTQTYTIRVGVCVEWYTDVHSFLHRCTLVVMERLKHSQNTHIHTALSLGSNEIPLKTGGPTIPLEGFTPFQGVVPITFGLSLLLFLFLFFYQVGPSVIFSNLDLPVSLKTETGSQKQRRTAWDVQPIKAKSSKRNDYTE